MGIGGFRAGRGVLGEGVSRGLQVAAIRLDRAQLPPAQAVLGRERQRGFDAPGALVHLAAPVERPSQVGLGDDAVPVEGVLQRPLELRDGFGVPAARDVEGAQVVARLGEVLVQLDGPQELALGVLRPRQRIGVEQAQRVVRLGQVVVVVHRVEILLERALHLPVPEHVRAQVVVDLGAARALLGGHPAAGGGAQPE